MSFLNHNQIEDYNNKGYVSPINIFSKQEAKEIYNVEKVIPTIYLVSELSRNRN